MMSNRRVVVTGIGLVSSLGIGTDANWTALTAGVSGVDSITKFDATQFATRIAGEVRGFDPLQFIEKKDVKKMDVFIQYAIAASQFAMDDACFRVTPENSTRVGVFIASGIGGFTTIEREHHALLEGGPRKISPFFIPSAIINLAAGQVSIRFGAHGPNSATCTACSASAHAIGDAFEIIRRGAADVMIAGGSEAAITPMGIGGFGALRALSTRNDDPARASRPFDKDRDGFIVGEGAGVLILEEYESARRRGARIYAELVGYGMSADAYHITAPSEDGDGAYRVMRAALESAGIGPGPGRLHQRARHLHAAGRQARDPGHQALFRRARAEAGGVVDQVDDRPLARRGRRPRGRHHRAGRASSTGAADHQPRRAGCRVRSGLHPERQAAAGHHVRPLELVRVRRHERRAAVQAIRSWIMKSKI